MCQDGAAVLCRARRDDNLGRRAKFRSSCLVMVRRVATFLTRRDTTRRHLRAATNQFREVRAPPCRAGSARCCRICFASTIRAQLRIAIRVARQV